MHPLQSRTRILEAAARVYAEHGFRGATTRRIADAAGVNEVTLFRTFGSKAELINAAVRAHAGAPDADGLGLPTVPVDPEAELTTWAAGQHAHLSASRALIRRVMSEQSERPATAPYVSRPTTCAAANLRAYVRALGAAGHLVDTPSVADADAAATMLMAALFSDAMGRELMPDVYPQPAERAPALYVRLFLRALTFAGVRAPSRDIALRAAP